MISSFPRFAHVPLPMSLAKALSQPTPSHTNYNDFVCMHVCMDMYVRECVVCGVWCAVCGVWCVWCVVCGVWCVVCGVCVW